MKKFKVKISKKEEVYFTTEATTAKEAVALANVWLVANGKTPIAKKAIQFFN